MARTVQEGGWDVCKGQVSRGLREYHGRGGTEEAKDQGGEMYVQVGEWRGEGGEEGEGERRERKETNFYTASSGGDLSDPVRRASTSASPRASSVPHRSPTVPHYGTLSILSPPSLNLLPSSLAPCKCS